MRACGAPGGCGLDSLHDVKMDVQVHVDEDIEDDVYVPVGVGATKQDLSVMNAVAVDTSAAVTVVM